MQLLYHLHVQRIGSLDVSEKLSTYPSPKPIFCLKLQVSVEVCLGEGWVGSFPETYNEMIQRIPPCERHLLYLLLDRGGEKEALPKLRQSFEVFEVAAARTRGIQRQYLFGRRFEI